MTMAGTEPIFIDTNVLIFIQQKQSPFHAAALARVQQYTAAGHAIWTSRQVFREYLAAMSKPGATAPPLAMPALLADVQLFETLMHIAEDGPGVTNHLIALLISTPCGGKQIHDANIVATMIEHGITHLLTHNVSDFQRFSGIITILPLLP